MKTKLLYFFILFLLKFASFANALPFDTKVSNSKMVNDSLIKPFGLYNSNTRVKNTSNKFNNVSGKTAVKEVFGSNKMAATYCDSYGNTSYQTSITSVEFNAINNTSTKPSGYSDYTAMTTDVMLGSSHSLSVKVNTDGNYRVYTNAWIDWNNDGVFDDIERYDLGLTRNKADGLTAESPVNVTVPSGATIGATRMRVSCRYNTYSDSCDQNFDGEVEDYTINVVPVGPNLTVSSNSLSFGYVANGSTSANQSFTLSGGFLTGFPSNITVTAPVNFEISLYSGSGFGSTVNVPYTSATLASTTIYTRFKPTSTTSYIGNLSCSGGGATTKQIEVSGYSLPYCPADGTTCDEYISRVQVGTIDNGSGCSGGYADYTAINTNMVVGASYPLTVTNGKAYSGDQCGVWVDWNNDGDFLDVNETIAVTGGVAIFNANILPPTDAFIGLVRMRVRITYTGEVSSCGNTTYGEVEDYLINVIPKIDTDTIADSPFCAGEVVSVPYSVTGTFNLGNIFTAQLSDGSGSFASPITIGTLSAISSGSISATIPTDTSTGSSYRIRVVGSNPSIIGADNGSDLVINDVPTITTTTSGLRCGTGTVVLEAAASAGTINWYEASTGGSSLGTGTSFTTPSIAISTTYWVDATNNGCATITRTSVTATINPIPTITGTTPNSTCSSGTVVLGATASAGTINWYAASTGGSPLGTGTSFTTPSIATTTIYWVDATANGCTTATRTSVTATISGNVEVVATLNTLYGCYTTLKAAFDKINDGTHKGNVTIKIKNSTAEVSSAILYTSGTGSSNYSSVNIYPTVTGVSISGNLATPLIDLNGADDVTIDGRINATGSTVDMTIINTSASATAGTSTIRFINGATNNTVKYVTIKGSETRTASGVLFFSTTNSSSGNNTNTIENNNITNATDANRPINAIYSLGTAGKENSGNNISNNNIYNFLKQATTSNGILLAGNTSAFTIAGNSFYETTSFAPTITVTYNAIQIINTAGNDFVVSNNYIGGSAAQCGGTAWTKTNATNNIFNAISLNVGTTTVSSVQNNTIQNFNWSNSANAVWSGINILGGNVNIGTVTGNTIGAASDTGSVTVTGATTGLNVYGINITSTGTVDCQKNTIESITAANGPTFASNVYGIYKSAKAGTTTISNNTVGSTTTANSINANSISTGSAQVVYGIYNAGTGIITIDNNTIANLTNSTTNATIGTRGLISGITSINGTNAISNNIIQDLKIANANTASTYQASVTGIALNGTTTVRNVIHNSIYNLSNSYATFVGSVIGISFTGSTGGNAVSENFIHSLSVNASSTGAFIYGVKIASGVTTYANNIINLGGNTRTTVYGIYETGVANNNNNLYFNTIYIGGSLALGTNKSYALYSAVSTNTRNFRNNIFMNARSTAGGSSLHYAAYFATTAGLLTVAYNDYFVSGTGSVLGYYGANKTVLPIVTSQDVNSLNINPTFATPGGNSFSDYITAPSLPGVFGTGVTIDYEGITRNSTPKMGALESSLIFVWKGNVDTNFGNALNWTNFSVPPNGAAISFAISPNRDCYLDQNRSLHDVTNTSSKKLVINGKQFTLTGNIVSATANQIDATAASSIFIFGGATAQSIPSGAFVSNIIDGLTLNNNNGLTQNGNITVQTLLTLTNGAFTIGANILTLNGAITSTSGTLIGGSTSNISIGGSGASTLLPSISLNNLTLNRSNGIALGGNVDVAGILTLTTGTLTVAANTLTIAGSTPIRSSGNINASNVAASLVFTNSSAIILPTSIFTGTVNNLTINGVGITSSNDFAVNGILNLQSANPSAIKGSLDMGSHTLSMGESATTIGSGDVTGIVKREHTFNENTEYSFGNEYTTINFNDGNLKPTWISIKITIGSVPSWASWTPDGKVKRLYKIASSSNSSTSQATINMRYLSSELDTTYNDETKLVFWHQFLSAAPVEYGKSNQNLINHILGVTGLPLGYVTTESLDDSQIALAYSLLTKNTWQGDVSGLETLWEQPNNWSGGHVPLSTEDILIPGGLTYYPSLTATANALAGTIVIDFGASITANSYNLTVSGAGGSWINNGNFNAGTGKVIFNHGIPAEVVTIAGTTDFYNIEVGASTTMQPVAGSILRIAGAGTADITSVADFSTIYSTIEWNGDNQNIVNPIGISGNSGYYNLILSGSGTKTMPATAMNIAGNFSIEGTALATAASALTIGGKLEIQSGATFATGNYNHTVGEHFDNSGTFTPSSGTTMTLNGVLVQNIYGTTPTTFEKLIINNNTGIDIFTNVTVNNTLTLTSGNLNVGTTLLTINGDINKTAGFLNVSNSSSLTFGGTTALTLPAALFFTPPIINNLTINRSGGIILGSDITVNVVLDLQSANPSATIGGLETGTFTLNMGATATTTGIGEVTGKVKRTTILPDIEYTFGNQFSSVTFPNIGTLPTEITLKISLGTTPSWKPDAIKRIYDISQIGGSGTRAVIKSHYLDSELNGNTEINLSFFSYIFPSSTLLDRGLSELNTTENWITLNNADFGNLPAGFGVIEHGFGVSTSNVITWDGSISTDWFDQNNWTPAFSPSATKTVIIPDAATTPNDPLIADSNTSTVETLSIQTGGILNFGANTELTVGGSSGAWLNNGTLNAGTGKVIFNHGVLSEIVTVAGITDFYNIEVGASTTIQPVAGSILRIAGAGTADITSVADFSTIYSTIEWNGDNQNIVNPSGISGNSGYYNLILSGSGIKTMPNTDMNIVGDFTITGTATAAAASQLTVSGNVNVGNGSTLATGSFDHSIAGNFQNDGTFTASVGKTISLNGTLPQTISGNSTTDFDILTINNTAGIAQSSLVNVNNILKINNGIFTIGSTTLGINGTITNPGGNIDVSSVSSLSFGGTSALTLPNNLFNTTPSVNDITVNRSGGVTLGNQSIIVNGTLTLSLGTLTLAANTLTLVGSSPTISSGNIDASNVAATMEFANTSAITLPSSLFSGDVNNFTVNGTGGIVSNGGFTITGILNLASANPSTTIGSLDMASSSILDMGEYATTVGAGDVTGIIKREYTTFLNGVEYSFGNQFTTLNFLNVPDGIKPAWIKCKITIGNAPTWRSEAVQRYYSFAQSGGTDRMIVKLHYLDSELHGAELDESQLVFWDAYTISTPFDTKYPRNKSGNDAADNWVQLTGLAINYIATSDVLDVKQWGLSYTNVTKHTWTGLGSPSSPGDWSLSGHWDGGVPGIGDDVLIPTTLPIGNSGYPYRNLLSTLAPSKVNSLEIETGATLSATDYDITIYGDVDAWVNDGTFNAGTATVIFANGDDSKIVSIAGTTNFYDLTVNDKTLIQPASGSITGIGGEFNTVSGSILDFSTNNSTIDYNGAEQIVINPNGGTTGYYNLSLSGSGVKTLPPTSFQIIGDFTLAGAATAITTSDLTIGANLDLSGASNLTISAGKTITINGITTNTVGNSGLVLKSDTSGTASLIHNSNNVPATVERYMSGGAEDWHFLSSPVADQSISGSWLPPGTYGNGTGYDMYVWDEPGICWVYKLNTTTAPNWSTVHPSSNFVTGRGYLYSVESLNPTKEFKGNLNNGSVSYPVTANGTADPLLIGFNLIGNPYPSSIDWKASAGWTRSNLLNSGGGYDMWIWNPATNNYGAYNSLASTGTNGVSNFIAPMQGFFVRATSNANIGMTNAIRTHVGASTWFKPSKTKNKSYEKPQNIKVKIASQSGLGSDEVLLHFGASSNQAGAAKLYSTVKTAPSAYLTMGKEELSIQYLTNTTDNSSVPLAFKPGSDGNYTLSIDFDNANYDVVILEDKKTKTFHNLLETPNYQFKASLNDKVDRFVLHFTPQDAVLEDNLSASIYYDGNDIILDLTLVPEQTEVIIYDILGRIILHKTVEGKTIHHLPISIKSQVYIVKAKSENQSITKKVLVY